MSEELLKVIQNPCGFSRGILGHDLWWKQEEILTDIDRHSRVAVKACHASSKTFTAAEAVLWWITRYPDGIVVTTAPTWLQISAILWREIANAVELAQDKILYPPINKTQLNLSAKNYAIGLSTTESVRFHGFHGPHILVVIDEAPGVRGVIWDAIEGMRAGGEVKILALGNPTNAGGPFYDAFTKDRDLWATHTISAFDTPNFQGCDLESLLQMTDDELDDNERPYLVTRRWVYERFRMWGETHPMWEARVLGNFPRQSEDALISLAWLEKAALAEYKERPKGKTELSAGIDVAGPGENETVLVVRNGGNIIDMKHWPTADARGEAVAALRQYKDSLVWVCVDAIGIGWYFAEHLRDNGFNVWGLKVGDPAYDKELFANLKAELFWQLRQRFEDEEISGLVDEQMAAQLATIRYKHNPKGQVVIEPKDEMASRGVSSPDRAEALMISYAADVGRPRIY